MSQLKRFSVLAFLVTPLAWVGAAIYTEDFTQDDGPPAGWVIRAPNVNVEAGALTLTPGGAGEVDAYAGRGGVGLHFDTITHIEFDISYPGEPLAWPYDHGGVIFCAREMTTRYGPWCYSIDFLAQDEFTPEVGRFRCIKFVNGAVNEVLAETDFTITEYEGTWEIDLTDTTITFTFDGVEQFTVEDAESRSGYFGFWAYGSPVENKIAVDNLAIEHFPGPCPDFFSDTVVMTEGREDAVLPIRIPLGANETEALTVTVSSRNSTVASPVSGTVMFDAGGPLIENAEIRPGVAGQTIIDLDVAGEDCGSTAFAEVLKAVAYEEDFTQDDGPPEGWYVASDTAQVINGELSLSEPAPAAGPFVWYGVGGEALNVPKINAVTCDIKFAQAALPIGAHGGIYLSPAVVTARSLGYMIDVMERETDNGFRIYKDNVAEPGLVSPRPPYVWDDEWHTWMLEFTPTGFTFSVDGEQLAEVNDLTYRGGYLAFWCYTGAAGQNMFIDNVSIEFGSSACPVIAPLAADNRPVNPRTVFTVTRPFGVNDAADYDLTVTSTDPAVAVPVDPVTGEPTAGSVVLTWLAGEASLTKTFEAACLSPGSTEFVLDTGATPCLSGSATFTVREPGVPTFCDTFSQADGPPEDWTVYNGTWQVQGESLIGECAAGEGTSGNDSWIWAGNPAIPIEGADRFSVTVDLFQEVADGVGRHAGMMLFAREPTYRWVTSGYEIGWLDRAADGGYRLIRWDDGVVNVIGGPTLLEYDLGFDWVVAVDETTIRFSVDGEEIFNVDDPTYREGYCGLWTYCNATQATFDNVAFGDCGDAGPVFKRADANRDGTANIADAVYILQNLFANGPPILCMDAADANDDEGLNIADAVYILQNLFAQGPPFPSPGPDACGEDPTGHPTGGPDLPDCDYCDSACQDPIVPCP